MWQLKMYSKINIILFALLQLFKMSAFAEYSSIATFEDVKKLKDDKNVLLIDVREPSELKEFGEIPGSINIPLAEVEEVLKELPAEEFKTRYGRQKPFYDFPIIFTCRSGRRSGLATDIALKLGFKKKHIFLGYIATIMDVTFEQMKQYEHDQNVLIIDVREPDEIKSTGLIGGSINIPLNSLEQALTMSNDNFAKEYGRPKPTADFPVVFTCKLGGRAAKACDVAKNLGLNKVSVYKGSWTEWSQKNKL